MTTVDLAARWIGIATSSGPGKVAQVARDGGDLDRPIGTSECPDCPWSTYCAQVGGEDDPTSALYT